MPSKDLGSRETQPCAGWDTRSLSSPCGCPVCILVGLSFNHFFLFFFKFCFHGRKARGIPWGSAGLSCAVPWGWGYLPSSPRGTAGIAALCSRGWGARGVSHYLCREMRAEVASQAVLWGVNHANHLWWLERCCSCSHGQGLGRWTSERCKVCQDFWLSGVRALGSS